MVKVKASAQIQGFRFKCPLKGSGVRVLEMNVGGGSVAHFEDFDVWMSSDWLTEPGSAVSPRCRGREPRLKVLISGLKTTI